MLDEIEKKLPCSVSKQTATNLPARLRMAAVYAVAQSMNGRVANTCNLSENWIGYSTRYGDNVGDFSALSMLTVIEVKQIGYELGVPVELIEKVPSDGLCGKTDEENFGFTYDILDRYIRLNEIDDANIANYIDYLHKRNSFKRHPMPIFYPLMKQKGPYFEEKKD